MAKKGIDISYWQETVDFEKVKNDGIDFVILRQGYRKQTDSKFFEYVEGAKKAGLEIHGVYHFCYALNAKDAKEEAKLCLSDIKKAKLDKNKIIVFYDFEYDTVKKAAAAGVTLGKTQCIEFTNAFCEYITSKGYKAGIYCNQDYYKNMYDAATLSKYPIWLAQYNDKAPVHECLYQQYSSKGKVDGIKTNVDMNWYFGKEDVKMGTTATDILNTMREWIGKSRSAGTHKDIIDLYNSHKPLARGYAVTYSDDYCAATVSAAFIKNDAVDLVGGTECGVQRYIDIFKAKGIWEEDGNVTPERGWIITFNWDDGTQPNDGWADHIGIVEKVNGNSITTIEGNIGGNVGRRVLQIGDGNIRGYAIPQYAAEAEEPAPALLPLDEIARLVIAGKYGTGAERKAALQAQGYNYREVQDRVNAILKAEAEKEPSEDDLKASSSVVFTLSNDSKPNKTEYLKAKVTIGGLYVRSWAGVKNSPLKSIPIIYKDTVVSVCDSILDDEGTIWYYVKINNKVYGFCSSVYLKQV